MPPAVRVGLWLSVGGRDSGVCFDGAAASRSLLRSDIGDATVGMAGKTADGVGKMDTGAAVKYNYVIN